MNVVYIPRFQRAKNTFYITFIIHNLLLKRYGCYVKRHSLGDKVHFNRIEVIT